MFSHTLTQTWQSGSNTLTNSYTREGGAESNIAELIPASSTNLAVNFTCDVSQLRVFVLQADVPMTVRTNNSSSPVNVFTLAAGEPFIWASGGSALRDTAGTAVTTDITGLFVTSTLAGTLNLRSLTDPTA